MTVKFPEVWDLDVLFPGGSESAELRVHMDQATPKLDEFEKAAQNFQVPSSAEDATRISGLLDKIRGLMQHLSQSSAFVGCLMAQNTEDKKAGILQSESSALSSRFQSALQKIQKDLTKTEDGVWTSLLDTDELKEFSFVLNEWREEAEGLLSEKEENLINALSMDGYHGWSQLYDMLVGDIKITMTVDGEEKVLSVGQANNRARIRAPWARRCPGHSPDTACEDRRGRCPAARPARAAAPPSGCCRLGSGPGCRAADGSRRGC